MSALVAQLFAVVRTPRRSAAVSLLMLVAAVAGSLRQWRVVGNRKPPVAWVASRHRR